jgi:hypothetical protein
MKCPWPDPGRSPYTGDKADAVRRLPIPEPEREQLAQMVALRFGWRQVLVRAGGVDGGRLADLRHMNFAGGRVCPGLVDTSMWPADRVERALAYTVGPWVVLVFSACGNVAMATDTAVPGPALSSREAHALRVQGGGAGAGAGAGSGAAGRAFGAAKAVPEPAGLGLAALGLCLVLGRRMRLARGAGRAGAAQ